jgi:multiple sugar transport system permease protein
LLTAQARRRGGVAAMMAPSALGLIALTLVPVGVVAYWSLTRYDLVTPPHYDGLNNYRFAANDDPFIGQAIRNTLWILAVGLPLQLLVATTLALLLMRRDRVTTAARTAMFLPSVLPPVAATLVFGWLLDPGRGPVNRLLGALHLPQPLWFHDPTWAKPGLVLLGLWGVGPVVILLIGGLVRIPETLYESARLEGASRLQLFRRITLPMLSPVLLFTVVIGIVGALQYFTEAFVAAANSAGTGESGLSGAPEGSTRFYSTWLFRQAFADFHVGYASMLAFGMFAVALAAMALLLVAARRYLVAEPRR